MKIRDLGEFGLINRIRQYPVSSVQCPASGIKGIGDDAAVIPVSRNKCLLWTTDVLIENVHFDLSFFKRTTHDVRRTTGFMLGWKAFAVNMSDIASMGGVPKYALVTLGLTGKEDVKFIDDLYRGMRAAGQGLSQIYRPDGNRGVESGLSHSVKVLGGDISKSPVLMIDTTLIGEVEKKDLLLRKGARPGDIICVTGSCGDSAAGFEILKEVHSPQSIVHSSKNRGPSTMDRRRLMLKHMMPSPRVKEARIIARNKLATAMIDSSDGLLISAGFICQGSGTGARIYSDKVPVSKQLKKVAASFSLRHLRQITLRGGEDYELVFTVPPARLKKAISAVMKATGTPVTAIGEITKKKGVVVISPDGTEEPAAKPGFEHF